MRSCPVAPTSKSGWYWSEDKASSTPDVFVVKTGLIPAFKLHSSHVVYLHCNLQLCLVGEDCPLKTQVAYSNTQFISNMYVSK